MVLNQVKKAIELAKQTKSVMYNLGDDFDKIIEKEGMVFGISKNGEYKVFFDGLKAKEWKTRTSGILCNVYHILNCTSDTNVLKLVSSDKDLTADLKTWMQIKDINAMELKQVLNVTAQTVYSWMQHKTLPNVKMNRQIARELGISETQIEW